MRGGGLRSSSQGCGPPPPRDQSGCDDREDDSNRLALYRETEKLPPEVPAKVEEHVENYTWIHQGVTGKPTKVEDLLLQSERVYNFQKVFSLRMGRVGRQHDYPPYRAMGPVTKIEYESRQERYDEQLKRLVEVDPDGKPTEEKMKELRKYREAQYKMLADAVYQRRGWDRDSIPTVEKLHELGIDFPEVLEVVEEAKRQL